MNMKLLTIKEASEATGFGQSAIRRAIKQDYDDFPSYQQMAKLPKLEAKKPGRNYLITEKALADWVENLPDW